MMTREQYENTIKTLMNYTKEIMDKAKTEKEKFDIYAICNMQIQSITDEYMRGLK